MGFEAVLAKAEEMKASDLFIIANKPLVVKIEGEFVNLTEEILTAEKTKSLILGLMTKEQQSEFLAKKELNFAVETPNQERFRISAFFERFNVGAVLRRIRADVPDLKSLNLPKQLGDFAMIKRGLVLMVGATGSGKSSTLAAMIKHRNSIASGHIITVEDPIEFSHKHDKCIITQREVGIDTDSFGIALKNTLRQAPDVILIGEIRSSDTMDYALQFAETGHLCLATLHASNANQALERIISFFPAMKHKQIWLELSLNLKVVIAQQLLPRADGKGSVPAVEILTNTPATQGCIKRGEVDTLKEYMSRERDLGMQTFDQSLFDLYKSKQVTEEEVLKYADSENELRLMIRLDNKSHTDTGSLDVIGLQE